MTRIGEEQSAVELKPCPFCSGIMTVREHSAFHPANDCWLATAGEHGVYELDEYDYAAWNRRAALAVPASEEVEKWLRGSAPLLKVMREENEAVLTVQTSHLAVTAIEEAAAMLRRLDAERNQLLLDCGEGAQCNVDRAG